MNADMADSRGSEDRLFLVRSALIRRIRVHTHPIRVKEGDMKDTLRNLLAAFAAVGASLPW